METTAPSGLWYDIVSFFKGRHEAIAAEEGIEAILQPVTKRSKKEIMKEVEYIAHMAGTEAYKKNYLEMQPDLPYYNINDFYEALITKVRKDIDSRSVADNGILYFEDYALPIKNNYCARTPSAASAHLHL